MDSIYVRNLGSANYGRDIEVTFRRSWRPDANRLVGESDVQRIAVCFAVNGYGADSELLVRAYNAQRNLTAIGNQDFLEHELNLRTYLRDRMANKGWPYSTGCPFFTRIFAITPETSDSISFI